MLSAIKDALYEQNKKKVIATNPKGEYGFRFDFGSTKLSLIVRGIQFDYKIIGHFMATGHIFPAKCKIFL